MVDIVGINTTNQQTNRVSGTPSKGNVSKGRESNSTNATGDRIEISAGAKEAQSVKRLVSSAQAEPDFRPEAVAAAKEKLEKGEFDGIEVSRQTARKILGF